MVDETVELLVSCPSSYSCPSVHSMLAFASATSIFWYYKKTGIAALVFAGLVGISRMYFFVHFPYGGSSVCEEQCPVSAVVCGAGGCNCNRCRKR